MSRERYTTRTNFNLRQVERQGGGHCLSLGRMKRGKLGSVVDRVTHDESYRTTMAQLQAWQATRDGPLEVARVIRSVLRA